MTNNKKMTGIIAGILLLIVVLVAAVIVLFAVRGKKEANLSGSDCAAGRERRLPGAYHRGRRQHTPIV